MISKLVNPKELKNLIKSMFWSIYLYFWSKKLKDCLYIRYVCSLKTPEAFKFIISFPFLKCTDFSNLKVWIGFGLGSDFFATLNVWFDIKIMWRALTLSYKNYYMSCALHREFWAQNNRRDEKKINSFLQSFAFTDQLLSETPIFFEVLSFPQYFKQNSNTGH